MKGHKLLSLSRFMEKNIWEMCPWKEYLDEEWDREVSHQTCMEACEAFWESIFHIWCPNFPKENFSRVHRRGGGKVQ